MPDPVVAGTENQQSNNAGGQGNANQNGQGGTNQQASQQVQDPKWLSYIPETEREDARKGYLMQSDYTKKTTEIADRQKAWDTEKAELSRLNNEYVTWWTGFKPTFDTINGNWDKIQKVLGGQAPAQTQQSPQQPEDPFRDYDLLPPVEQAKRIGEQVVAQHVTKALQAQEQKFNQAFQQREQYYQNYLNIWTDAQERARKNPDFPVREYLQQALEYSSGKGNPLEMAAMTVTKDSDLKKQQEQWDKAGYERAKLEFQNQQQPTGAVQDGFIPLFKQTPQSREQIAEAVRHEASTKGIAW
jgi:hypothetical protein